MFLSSFLFAENFKRLFKSSKDCNPADDALICKKAFFLHTIIQQNYNDYTDISRKYSKNIQNHI